MLKSVLNNFKTLEPRLLLLEEPVLATQFTVARSFAGNGLVFYLKFMGTFHPAVRSSDEEDDSQAGDKNALRDTCARCVCVLKQANKKNKPQVALFLSFSGLRVVNYLQKDNDIAVAWSDMICMSIDDECDRTFGVMIRNSDGSSHTVIGLKTYNESTFKARTIKDQITLLLNHMDKERGRAALAELRRLRKRNDTITAKDNRKNELKEQTKKHKSKENEEETDLKAAVKSQEEQKPQPQPQPQPVVPNLIDLDVDQQAMATPKRSSNLDVLLELFEDGAKGPKPKPVKRAGAMGAKKSRKPHPALPAPEQVAQAPQPENPAAPPHYGGARPKVLAIKMDAANPTARLGPDTQPPPGAGSRACRRLSLESECELKDHFSGDYLPEPIPSSRDGTNPSSPSTSTIYYEIVHSKKGGLVDIEPHSHRAQRHSSPLRRNTVTAEQQSNPFGTLENIATACLPLVTMSPVKPEKNDCINLEDLDFPPPIPPKRFLSTATATAPTGAAAALPRTSGLPSAFAPFPSAAAPHPIAAVPLAIAAAPRPIAAAAVHAPAPVAAASAQERTVIARRPPPPEPPVKPFDAVMSGGVQMLMKELKSKPQTTSQPPPPPPASTIFPSPRAN